MHKELGEKYKMHQMKSPVAMRPPFFVVVFFHKRGLQTKSAAELVSTLHVCVFT